MRDALAVQVQGWAMSSAPGPVVCEVLGETARQTPLSRLSAGWRVEDPLMQGQPVGPVRSLVTFASEWPIEVHIVPGSQGQHPPPGEDIGHALLRLSVDAGRSLLLDARCWYRASQAEDLQVRLWVSQPSARCS
jgi:hypothetical protein